MMTFIISILNDKENDGRVQDKDVNIQKSSEMKKQKVFEKF